MRLLQIAIPAGGDRITARRRAHSSAKDAADSGRKKRNQQKQFAGDIMSAANCLSSAC